MTHLSPFGRIFTNALFSFLVAAACMLLLMGEARAQQTVGHVTWSPDGKYIAFYARWYGDTEIFMMEVETGVLLQQTANDAGDSGPAFTSDGEHMLFASRIGGNSDIYRVNLTGGEPDRLFGDPDTDELFPFELGDGRIAYAARKIQTEEGADPLPLKIRVWNPETGRSTGITDGDSTEMIFRSNAKGDRYLLASNRSGKSEIYLTDAEGNINRQLTNKGEEEGAGTAHPRFSKDGKKFLSWGDEGTGEAFNFMLKIHDLQTGKVTIVPRPVRYTALADLSPDATQVAFAAATEEEGLSGKWRLYIMNVDGTDLRGFY